MLFVHLQNASHLETLNVLQENFECTTYDVKSKSKKKFYMYAYYIFVQTVLHYNSFKSFLNVKQNFWKFSFVKYRLIKQVYLAYTAANLIPVVEENYEPRKCKAFFIVRYRVHQKTIDIFDQNQHLPLPKKRVNILQE